VFYLSTIFELRSGVYHQWQGEISQPAQEMGKEL
jgi:hypothetical protein